VELNQIKTEVKEKLDRLWDWLQKDAESRLREDNQQRFPKSPTPPPR